MYVYMYIYAEQMSNGHRLTVVGKKLIRGSKEF